MTSGIHRGQGRKRQHETGHPEPRREMMPTLLGLAFKAHLFHPKPACVASSLPAALVFSKQENKLVRLLGLCSRRCLCLECPPSFLPRHSSKIPSSLLWRPSGTPQQRASFLLRALTAPLDTSFPFVLQLPSLCC